MLIEGLLWGFTIKAEELIHVRKGERPDEKTVQHAEHRGVHPNAERESDQRDHGEARRAKKRADGEAQVGDHGKKSQRSGTGFGTMILVIGSGRRFDARPTEGGRDDCRYLIDV